MVERRFEASPQKLAKLIAHAMTDWRAWKTPNHRFGGASAKSHTGDFYSSEQ